MTMLDALNAAVTRVPTFPRVHFEKYLSRSAANWIGHKHDAGMVHEPGMLAALVVARARYDTPQIFDCGALYGYFSLFCGGMGAKVTAFESHPVPFQDLALNCPHAMCVNAALSDRLSHNERVWINAFHIFEKPDGGWDALRGDRDAMRPRNARHMIGWAKTDFITLDAFCEAANVWPDIIKIDVEAYQTRAVMGALKTIDRRPVVIIELHDAEKTSRLNTSNRATLSPFFERGYRCYLSTNFRDMDASFVEVTEPPESLSLAVMVP